MDQSPDMKYNEHSPNLIKTNPFNKMIFLIKCQNCGEIFENPYISHIYNHQLVCQQLNIQEQPAEQLQANIQSQPYLEKKNYSHERIQKFLDDNSICDSSKKVFKNSVVNFYQRYNYVQEIKSSHIIEYLKGSKNDLNIINAIMQIRKLHQISLNFIENQDIVNLKKQAKRQRKENSHNCWSVTLIYLLMT